MRVFDMSPGESLELLTLKAREWGGDLICVDAISNIDSDDLTHCPFSHHLAIDHKAKHVYYTPHLPGITDLGGIIHEFGHVFATLEDPNTAEEYDFLGWEWLLALEVGLRDEWLLSMDNYSLAAEGNVYAEDFGYLDDDQRSDLLEERIDYAESLGLIVDGQCVSIRD